MITGQHRNGVISARTRVDVLLDTFRRRQPFTHFLAFFLNEVEVQERFLKFQKEVLEKCSMVSRKQNLFKKWFIIQTGWWDEGSTIIADLLPPGSCGSFGVSTVIKTNWCIEL